MDNNSYRFECFKATGAIFYRFYSDPLGSVAFGHTGDTHEDSIFKSVIDWFDKEYVK